MYYVENGSKNRSGSYKDKPDDNKVTKHYGISTLGDRCYYHVLKFYFEKLSPTVLSAVFIGSPKTLSSTAPWFTTQPVGRKALASVVKTMCESVGVKGKTNHSLRATGTTAVFVDLTSSVYFRMRFLSGIRLCTSTEEIHRCRFIHRSMAIDGHPARSS